MFKGKTSYGSVTGPAVSETKPKSTGFLGVFSTSLTPTLGSSTEKKGLTATARGSYGTTSAAEGAEALAKSRRSDTNGFAVGGIGAGLAAAAAAIKGKGYSEIGPKK